MFISRTPLRISLFGGGTDFPSYYNEYGGLCLSATIDKYVYVIVKKRHDNAIRVSYSQTEFFYQIEYLKHDLIREAMKLMGVHRGVEIVTMADVPGHGSGLASSSAVTVGALHALSCYNGAIDHLSGSSRTKIELARLATKIECDILGKTPGVQDQYSVAWGGLNLFSFKEDDFEIREIPWLPRWWMERLLLFQVPEIAVRDSQMILDDQNKRTSDNLSALHGLKHLAEMGGEAIRKGEFDDLGPMLDEGWKLKRSLSSSITTPQIDEMYQIGLAGS